MELLEFKFSNTFLIFEFFWQEAKTANLLSGDRGRLNKITKLAKSVLVDHKAYLQASADKKQLDIENYRKKVLDEFSDDDDDNIEEHEEGTGVKSLDAAPKKSSNNGDDDNGGAPGMLSVQPNVPVIGKV